MYHAFTAKKHSSDSGDYKTFTPWHWLGLVLFLGGAIGLIVHKSAIDFHTSILPPATPPPYDGTALPIAKAPKWTELSDQEWDASYSQIPSSKMQNIPVYDPERLKISSAELGWSAADKAIRNEKITYSVPYMGNYQLDGHEYVGSHLAIDIKVPHGTPIFAIGNGTVVKVSEQSSGFGKHVVVRHDDFPSLYDPSETEKLYSSYSHLGSILVSEGDIVLKGQKIATSGVTGTATTPHLHFQIDNTKAPWHPFWPFTYQEATAAGLTFTEAINAGLGMEKALANTVHPLLYVQTYTDGYTPPPDPPSSSGSDGGTTGSDDPDSGSDDADSDPDEEDVTLPPPAPKAVAFELEHDEVFVKGKTEKIIVQAVDEDGSVVKSYKPKHGAYVKVELGGAEVPQQISAAGFNHGKAQFTITPTASMGLQIMVTDNTISGTSDIMRHIVFTDVDKGASYYSAVNFLKDHDVIGGYPDGTFRPDAVVSRVEALKFILNGINARLIAADDLPFPDTYAQEWYADYVLTGYTQEIVKGYPDGTFGPAATVNRAEFLKMLLTAMGAELEAVTKSPYSDVSQDAWYAPYVQFAQERNLLTIPGSRLRPEAGMTRAEVADLIYRTILLKVSGADHYASGLKVEDSSVRDYFS